MDELVKLVVEQFPTFLGLILLAWVLLRQNERLLDTLFDELDNLSTDLADLRKQVEELKQSR